MENVELTRAFVEQIGLGDVALGQLHPLADLRQTVHAGLRAGADGVQIRRLSPHSKQY